MTRAENRRNQREKLEEAEERIRELEQQVKEQRPINGKPSDSDLVLFDAGDVRVAAERAHHTDYIYPLFQSFRILDAWLNRIDGAALAFADSRKLRSTIKGWDVSLYAAYREVRHHVKRLAFGRRLPEYHQAQIDIYGEHCARRARAIEAVLAGDDNGESLRQIARESAVQFGMDFSEYDLIDFGGREATGTEPWRLWIGERLRQMGVESRPDLAHWELIVEELESKEAGEIDDVEANALRKMKGWKPRYRQVRLREILNATRPK